MLIEYREEAIAKCMLGCRREGPMPIDSLVELARPSAPAAPMRQGEVVEDEQIAGPQGDLNLDGFDI